MKIYYFAFVGNVIAFDIANRPLSGEFNAPINFQNH